MIEMYLLLPACLARSTYNDVVLAKTLYQKYKLLPQYTLYSQQCQISKKNN